MSQCRSNLLSGLLNLLIDYLLRFDRYCGRSSGPYLVTSHGGLPREYEPWGLFIYLFTL